MSMPQFPNDTLNLTRDDVINQILSSIAMEELGLSHILNAEGEKLQYILGTLEGSTPPQPPTVQEVLQVNESVQKLLETTSYQQMFLKNKMSDALLAFMRTGDPNTSALPHWPKYTEDNCETMILNDQCEVKNNPDKNGRESLE